MSKNKIEKNIDEAKVKEVEEIKKFVKDKKDVVTKRVMKEFRGKLKREAQQSRQLRQYLKKVNKIPYLSEKEIVKLWDELKQKIEEGKKKERLKTEKQLFKAHLREVVSTAKKMRNETYIKPYFTFLELIKEGEKGLWRAIHQYYQSNWPPGTTRKSTLGPIAISREIIETAYRKRYKIITGKDYQDKLDLISIVYVGHPILDHPALTTIERIIADERFRKILKEIKNKKISG